ncbi:hypothetical protein Ptr902_02496 [Pyrenophora tritici-repentis]|nr:hypothetical protein Ptr902_02496 [Pyrenophora tritici-repentis]
MASREAVDKKFAKVINEMIHLYDTDELDLAIAKAYELLHETFMAPYHRMKAFLLLGSTRRLGRGKFDIAIKEAQEELEDLDKVLKDDKSEGDYDCEDIEMKEEVDEVDEGDEEPDWEAMDELDINELSGYVSEDSDHEAQNEGQK